MANRVRYLSLVLAGFGRYDRPTRFDLSGRSCSFTSANELGKSTFQAGLLATLFGPPAVRAKAAAFQSRYRSWNGPIAFFGELDFTVNDEPWRVRQDFESLETKVWRLAAGGSSELRLHVKPRNARQPGELEPYARLLQDWLGIADQAFYEAMFTISQESTLATAWQIDARIASLVYGPVVERLDRTLHELFTRFRDITRATREYQISLGSHGERNGRSDGRLDVVTARIESLQQALTAARERVHRAEAAGDQVQHLSHQLDQHRNDLNQIDLRLQAWRDWIELESRLQPAVESYQRLAQLNERCQQLTKPLAEIRSRLVQDALLFDSAPHDLVERLEYLPLLRQATVEARQRHDEATEIANQLHRNISQLQSELQTEFAGVRGRSDLPDQIEELRLIRDELARNHAHWQQLTEPDHTPDDERVGWQRRRAELERWRESAEWPPLRVAELRRWLESFCSDQSEYEELERSVQGEAAWLAEHERSMERKAAERVDLVQSRRLGEQTIEADREQLRRRATDAERARRDIDRAREELGRRYVDFAGAPADLPAIWDRLHRLETLRTSENAAIADWTSRLRGLEARVIWRRSLAVAGSVVALVCVLLDHRWPGWLAAMIATGLSISLHWIYPLLTAQIAEFRRIRQRHEAELLRLDKQRELMVTQLGPKFIVPGEREAEWRRLWPTYRRDLEKLAEDEGNLPTAEQVAQWTNQAKQLGAQLDKYRSETNEMLSELDESLARARSEHTRRTLERDRMIDRMRHHVERYFGECSDWRSEPVSSLASDWLPFLSLAAAAGEELNTISQLAAWCRTLDHSAWGRWDGYWCELRSLDLQLTPDVEAERARQDAIAQLRTVVDSLELDAARLQQSIAPFTAETDLDWLRSRLARADELESQLGRLQLELDCTPKIEDLAQEVSCAETELQETLQRLDPLMQRFDHDPARIVQAMEQRAEWEEQARHLEQQAAELLAESDFDSLEQLAHEAGKAEGLVGTIRTESQELLARAEELWQAVSAPAELALQRAAELESQRQQVDDAIHHAERERAELVATIRQIESDPACDLAAIEAELNLLTAERQELEKSRDAIAAEFQEANRLRQELQRVERTALEGRITAYFADFSRSPGRRVELDEDLRLTVKNDDGTRYEPKQLSHGARDQLYLAVYLATTSGFDLPFILDDPFVNCDAERLAAIRTCWDRLTPDHQLILLSHNHEMAAWAPPLQLRDAA